MAKIKPLRNYVLVKRSLKKKTKGGILLPDSAQEKPREGTVVRKGEGKRNEQGVLEPLDVQVGDTILFNTYAVTEVKDTGNDEEFLLIAEDDILGVYTK